MRRADYMASIMRQLGKLSTDALKYLDQWSFPFGVVPILRAYDEGELLRRVDCDMEVALAMEEIVRCRDCLSWHRGYCCKHAYEVVNEYGDPFTEGAFPMDASDFCSLGERREGAES